MDQIDEQIDLTKIPDIKTIKLTKKETLLYIIINDYFKKLDLNKIYTMIDIVESKSKI